MSGRTVIGLLLALTILVSAIFRPPGTMLVMDGGTLTYEICTGGETQTIEVALGDETPEEIDIGCDFFAAQIAALLHQPPYVTPTDAEIRGFVTLGSADLFLGQAHNTFNTPRAPPVLS